MDAYEQHVVQWRDDDDMWINSVSHFPEEFFFWGGGWGGLWRGSMHCCFLHFNLGFSYQNNYLCKFQGQLHDGLRPTGKNSCCPLHPVQSVLFGGWMVCIPGSTPLIFNWLQLIFGEVGRSIPVDLTLPNRVQMIGSVQYSLGLLHITVSQINFNWLPK